MVNVVDNLSIRNFPMIEFVNGMMQHLALFVSVSKFPIVIIGVFPIWIPFVHSPVKFDRTNNLSPFVNFPYFFHFPFALNLCSKVAKNVRFSKPIKTSFSITFLTPLLCFLSTFL